MITIPYHIVIVGIFAHETTDLCFLPSIRMISHNFARLHTQSVEKYGR